MINILCRSSSSVMLPSYTFQEPVGCRTCPRHCSTPTAATRKWECFIMREWVAVILVLRNSWEAVSWVQRQVNKWKYTLRDAQASEHFAGAATRQSVGVIPSYLCVLAPLEILWFLLQDHLAAKCFLHVFNGCLSHRFYSANTHKTKFTFVLLSKTSFLIHNCSQQYLWPLTCLPINWALRQTYSKSPELYLLSKLTSRLW